jgi:hypothetical protein
MRDVKLRDHEELEQACQFLHDNGILLHYDDPSLSGLYFLDPQWLCDMMAHVVAIRDVNPFVQNGECSRAACTIRSIFFYSMRLQLFFRHNAIV